jgi:phasin family protein
MDVYAAATERSAERVQAMVSSALVMGRGIQKLQRAWLEMLDRSMQSAAQRPRDLLRCKTLTEVAEVQRELYADTVNNVFESSGRLLDLASRAAQEAARPLQTQPR